MIILGISAYFHDAAAAIFKDGELIYAAEEERFSRIKHDNSFPIKAIEHGLKSCQLSIADVDVVVYYEKPLLKFERILESYYKIAPQGVFSFARAMPHWMGDKLNIRSKIFKQLKQLGPVKHLKKQLKFTEHHLSHAASAYYPSDFEDAAILTIDGVGEWATATIAKGEQNDITLLEEMHYPHSVGLLYSAFTQFLGFKVNSGEYKLMGLAGYGNPQKANRFVEIIKNKLVSINSDGSIQLQLQHFKFHKGLKTIAVPHWEKLLGINAPKQENFETEHAHLALAIQKVTEEVVLKMATHAKKITESNNLCLSGGVALNCVANGVLERAEIFERIYIQPASGDAGGAIGAGLAYHHIALGKPRKVFPKDHMLNTSLAGPEISDQEVITLLKEHKVQVNASNAEDVYKRVCQSIDEGKVIGWCQGRMEFGPRALGNRSILGDPRSEAMQQQINQKVKKRESFRPFAPAIMEEHAPTYFGNQAPSPHMLMVYPLLSEFRKSVPESWDEMSIVAQLKSKKSVFPAITHADFSARLQTVSQESNPIFYGLLKAFYDRTDCPMLINTSFNERGEPIVQSAKDAFHAFMRTSIDILVLNNFVIEKKDVTHLNISNFEHNFRLD